MMQGSSGTNAVASEEPEELVRFREQWLAEVRSKKKEPQSQDGSAAPAAASEAPVSQAPRPLHPLHTSSVPVHHSRTPHGVPSSPPAVRRLPSSVGPAPLGPALQRAVEVYRKAVQHEQQSELDDALRLYRTAFRMDPNVDRAYQMVEDQLQAAALASAPAKTHHRKTSSAAANVDAIVEGLQNVDLAAVHIPVARIRGEGLVTGTLATLISSWPEELSFEAEDEQEGVPIRLLPNELLTMILRLLDHSSIERFAQVNRKARVVTLDGSIWRPMVQSVLKPPQIPTEEDFEALVLKYMTDYRCIYIEHPRIRYDGVYIAVCHYIRNGVGPNAWINYSHLVTYYRYLRFLPDGQVLSLLANEGLSPQQAIPLLNSSLQMKGFYIGTWYLDGTTVHIEDLLEPAGADTRYSFQMILDLRSRPLGRWNRLDFREYDSVYIESGEATPLALKNERPFWFSKVRSYV
ncbi:SCF ubiquitin ligase complex subunit HRT3 [Trametes versicolor FP-101664 SS1]|uniref:SCF ubiquitin ligase complex subunit HRT3 n=1 Tax=Trametes versicolor (strain FP-101664) TaxID=717944 RepID=UPI00046222DD|nr:SCF ubiquitin ligase complex subunit HRT3 [Trametes versicolor FP-101664 SS1]EIW58273.1 hypothetical protein TRAVEDRAFT_37252 [Trametes versicolor FP-101664 SS1]